jgi:hypothetical protein
VGSRLRSALAARRRGFDARRRLFQLSLLLAVVLVFPAGNLPIADGLPFTHLAELAGFLLVAPLLVSRRARAAVVDVAGRGASSRTANLVAGALAVALAAKVALLVGGVHDGWHACYRAYDVPVTGGKCERSFDNPLFANSATRYDPSLEFGSVAQPDPSPVASGSNWNLSFFNSTRFDKRGLEIDGYREHQPFQAAWTADVRSAGDSVAITYVGEGTVELGDRSLALPPAYDRERTVRTGGWPEVGEANVTFAYRPRPGSETAENGPYAELRVAGLEPAGPSTVQLLVARGVDLVVLVALAALAAAFAIVLRPVAWPLLGALGVSLILVLPGGDPQSVATRSAIALIVILAALLWRPSWRAVLLACWAVVLVTTVSVGHGFDEWDSVLYRTAGSDFLVYESTAREILESGSLRGGEDVFFTQPAMRYILFGLRVAVGDSDAILAIASQSLIVIGTIFALAATCLLLRLRLVPRLVALGAGAGAIVLLVADPVLTFSVRSSLSEWPVWGLLPFATAIAYLAPDRRWLVGGIVLLALCAITRANLLPGIAVIAAACLWRARRDRLAVAMAVGCFLAVLVLPALHNLAFGDRLVPFTTSAPRNVRLPASDLSQIFGDADVRELFGRQVELLAYWGPEATADGLRAAIRFLQIAWLAAFGWAVVRWRQTLLASKLLLLAPALMLAPYVVYDSLASYPRHVIAGHLLMATTITVVLGFEWSRSGRFATTTRFERLARWRQAVLTRALRIARAGGDDLPHARS